MKNLTWQNSEQLFVAQALIKKLTHSAAEIRTNMKHLLLILMSIIGLGSVSAQSQNVKCTYAATHVISDAVKNIEDAHIRKMMIQKFQNDKKTFTMLYADGKYSFSEGSNGGDTGIKVVGLTGDIYIDMAKDSVFAQKYIVDKLFLIKDKYKPYEWTLTNEKKTINGKECTKATATGSIPVTAWFCTEIPLGVGPLGYLGLPGIVMQLDTPTYSYVLQEMVNLNETPSFEVPTKGKVVSQEEFNKLEAERIKSRGVEAGKVRIISM